jgi:small conductance mechanosensitive channel
MSESTIKLLLNVGITLAIILAGYIIISILCRIIRKALHMSKLDGALHAFIINCTRIVLWIMVAFTAMEKIGIPIPAFLTALGAAGVAVALALKDSLGNFAGGIMIILTKPFSKGDYIQDYQTAGQVEKIDLLYTTLVTFDNKVITVPNGKLSNSTVVNFSRAERRRVDCIFSVGYQEDILRVKDILRTVAESNPSVLPEPEMIIGIAGQGEGKIQMDLKAWCLTQDYQDVKYYLEEQVKLAFDEAGIIMPYPQMEVRVKRKL